MDTITVPVTIPEGMAPYINWEDKGLSFVQKAMLLYPMIQNLVISHGRAAEILGVRMNTQKRIRRMLEAARTLLLSAPMV